MRTARHFHPFKGPDKLQLAEGTRAARVHQALRSAIDRTITADGLWHFNRLMILATCNPYIGWEGLRVTLTATSMGSLLYFGVSADHLKPRKMAWSAVFVVLQALARRHVVNDLLPAQLDADEQRFFERNLAPFGLPSAVFRALLDAGETRELPPGAPLLREGALNY